MRLEIVEGVKLTVREIVDQLELDSHHSGKHQIFDDDILPEFGRSNSESNIENNLGIDFTSRLSVSHVEYVVRHER